jgi:hypothetical protein
MDELKDDIKRTLHLGLSGITEAAEETIHAVFAQKFSSLPKDTSSGTNEAA